MKTTYTPNEVKALVASLKDGQRITKQELARILVDLTKVSLCDLAKALDLHRYSSLCREAVANMILERYEDILIKVEAGQEEAAKKAIEHKIANNVYEDLSDEARDYLKDHPELRQNEDHDPTDLRHNIDALVKYYEYPDLRDILEREERMQDDQPTHTTAQEKLQAFIEVNHIPEDFLLYCVTESELVYNQEYHAGEPLSSFSFQAPLQAFDVTTLNDEQAYDVLEQCEYYLEDHAAEAKEVVEIKAVIQTPVTQVEPTGVLAHLLKKMIASIQETQQQQQYLLASC